MSENIPVVAAGVVVGLAGALVLGRYLETLLFEVAPTDPLSAVLAASAAAALAVLTSYVTARSAAQRVTWGSDLDSCRRARIKI